MPTAHRPCPHCGASIPSDAYFCKHCNQSLPRDASSVPTGSPLAAGVSASDWYCLQCGQFGKPKKVTKGSFAIEVVLWLLFIVPGVIYSLWRLTTKHTACRFCHATTLVPLSSPKAQEALKAKLTQPA